MADKQIHALPEQTDTTPTEIMLDPIARAYILDLQTQVRALQDRAMVAMQTTLELEVRRNKLQGSWKISEDGTKLIKERAEKT